MSTGWFWWSNNEVALTWRQGATIQGDFSRLTLDWFTSKLRACALSRVRSPAGDALQFFNFDANKSSVRREKSPCIWIRTSFTLLNFTRLVSTLPWSQIGVGLTSHAEKAICRGPALSNYDQILSAVLFASPQMSIGLVWDDASLQGRMDGCRLAKQETIKPQINEPLHSVCRLPHSPILILQPLLTPNARAKSFRYLFYPLI